MSKLSDNTSHIRSLIDGIANLPKDRYQEGYESGYETGYDHGYTDSETSQNLINIRAGTFTLTNAAILGISPDTPCYLKPNTIYTLVIEYENLNTTVVDSKIYTAIGCGKSMYEKDLVTTIPYLTENNGKIIHTFNTSTKLLEGERCFVQPIRIIAPSNTGTTSVYWKNVMLLNGAYNIDTVPQYIPVTKAELARGLFVSSAEGSVRGDVVDTDISSLHNYSFYGCSQLEMVSFPNLQQIYAYSFFGCTKLRYADLGLANSLNAGTFGNCTSLKTLILRSTNVITLHATSAFTNSGISLGTGFIYVPNNLVNQYKIAVNWSTYASQIRAIEDYPEICG